MSVLTEETRLTTVQLKDKFDWWLAGLCLARTFNGLVFMTYAATLPVLQREWGMSAAAAGSIAGGFQLGYAVSLVIFSFLTESVNASYMGAAFGLRSVLGFGAGAISPVVLGAVLDFTNPGVTESGQFYSWGWAFSVLGIGGAGAWLAAIYYGRIRKNLLCAHSRNM